MIVYSETKANFINDVKNNVLDEKVKSFFIAHGIAGGAEAEIRSWIYSTKFIRDVIDTEDIEDSVNVAIEYQIPLTSKRVDFLIVGKDKENKENVVIIELKQWEKAQKIDDISHHSVKAFIGGKERTVSHPSYQAYSYSLHIKNVSSYLQDNNIGLVPCAFLHNFKRENINHLNDTIYKEWTNEAPFFIKDEPTRLRDFILKYIRCNTTTDILYNIEHGRLRPAKALQYAIFSVLRGNNEFVLLDDQVVAFDKCLSTFKQCLKDKKKRTIIIKGGPGTGKSVLAINLLAKIVLSGNMATYITKNAAPRNAFLNMLPRGNIREGIKIKSLFRSPFGLSNTLMNSYECLIIDETHRLVEKMYGDWRGINQVKECINAALLSIFLIDEDQKITTKDIGSVDNIEKFAGELGSIVITGEDYNLKSQFRCNGSNAYIQFINNLLQIGDYIHIPKSELNYDFRIYDDIHQMKEDLKVLNASQKHFNKCRMVAGYCYDWNVKNKRGEWDIIIGDFQARWNLDGDDIWAINPNSFEEVGCIHTAQGLEFDYVGVIIGKDLVFKEGKIVVDKSAISKDDKTSGIRTADEALARRLILNTYKTLLTRGQKGCFVYCEDENLRNFFSSKHTHK